MTRPEDGQELPPRTSGLRTLELSPARHVMAIQRRAAGVRESSRRLAEQPHRPVDIGRFSDEGLGHNRPSTEPRELESP